MYDAVCAVVIKTEALTHEAEVAVIGTNEIAFAVVAVVAHEAVPNNEPVIFEPAVVEII